MIESMFDELSDLGNAALLAAMSEAQRVERSAAARRLVAAGLLTARREAGPGQETQMWCVEDFDVAAAEVGAELGISRHRAAADMSIGLTLTRRLTQLAHRCLAGDVDVRVIAAIDTRTLLVQDPDILARLDALLAEAAPTWNALSRKKLYGVIDWLVFELDPDARRMTRDNQADRWVDVSLSQDGTAELSGRLPGLDGATLDKRLDAMATSVCREDPRTKAQRRADALLALADGTALACACGLESCTTPSDPAAPASQVIVHVIAEQSTVDGDGDKPAYAINQGVVPAQHLRDVIQTGRAKTRPLAPPEDLTAERGYRPSRALADFLLCRDMTCRFPGCGQPAESCDNDHTTPWPYGATHPGNLKKYCRHHHLMKTFWTGPGGWQDVQHPDGTITFTSPSGRTFATTPPGALLFPQLLSPTPQPSDQRPLSPPRGNTLRMPLRQRSRAAEKAARIAWERGVNRARIAAYPAAPF